MSTPTIIEYLSEQLVQTRKCHPSFRLMNNRIDDSLFPNGIITYEAEAKDSNNKIKKVKEIVIDSWLKGCQNHLTIVGEGGIGKTVTLLSLPDKLAPHPVPAIYIPLHDIIGEDGVDDIIEKYIKKWVLDDDEELFRQLKMLRKTEWINGPQLLLLLDGFNELSSDKLRGIISRDIEHWAYRYQGVQIITSSRYDIHNYVFTQSDFSKIELKPITKEKAVEYLNKVGEPIPANDTVLDLITNPLLLTLYIKTESIRNDRRSSFARFRETKNAGTLIWNYLQCELWRFRNRKTQDAKACVIAMEFIAPYIAWTMQQLSNNSEEDPSKAMSTNRMTTKQDSGFSVSEETFLKSIDDACNSLKEHIDKLDNLPQHIKTTLQQSHGLPESDHICALLKEQLSIFVGFEIKDERAKKKGNDKNNIRYKLMHQQFRDALAAMHLINLSYLSGKNLPQAWNSPINHYVMQFIADLISEEEAMRMWEQNRKTNPQLETATLNQLELQKRINSCNFSKLDFTNLDLSNISLSPYRVNNTILNLPTDANKLESTVLSAKTFSVEGHSYPVNVLAVTPDGKCIVSGSHDHTIRTWDLETGNPIGKPIEAQGFLVNAIAITPDSRHIVSGSDDHKIRIWDLGTGIQIGKPIAGHSASVNDVIVTPDGKHIISGSDDHTIRVWDLETRNQIGKPIEGHKYSVTAVAVTPDGKRIVSGSKDHTIRIWDMETRNQIGKPIEGHESRVNSVTVTPDGRHIVSGSLDRTIRVWDLETRKQIGGPIQRHKKSVNTVVVSPDGKYFISGSGDHTIFVWNLQTRNTIGIPIEGHSGSVYAVAVTPDGKRIVSGSSDNTIRIWDLETGKPIGMPIQGHNISINAVTVSPDNKCIISGLRDHTIRIWDLETGNQIGMPIFTSVSSVVVTPDCKRIISGSSNGTICIWNIKNSILIGKPIFTTLSLSVLAVTLDSQRIVSGTQDGIISVWNIETGEQVLTFKSYWSDLLSIILAPDIKCAIRRLWYNTIEIVSFEADTKIGKHLEHKEIVSAAAMTSDGKRIISRSGDNNICIWDLNTGTQIKTIKEKEKLVKAVAVDPEGKHIISGSDDGTIRIIDMDTGKEKTIQVLPLSVVGLDFSKAIITTPELKETLRQNGAKVDPD